MPMLMLRQFVTLFAVAVALAAQITEWHGTALGAEAAIYLSQPDADAIIARSVADIDRLESVFSL